MMAQPGMLRRSISHLSFTFETVMVLSHPTSFAPPLLLTIALPRSILSMSSCTCNGAAERASEGGGGGESGRGSEGGGADARWGGPPGARGAAAVAGRLDHARSSGGQAGALVGGRLERRPEAEDKTRRGGLEVYSSSLN